ncbi:MAG: O-antigen ligase family protein [Elusimicrobiota bacterium]
MKPRVSSRFLEGLLYALTFFGPFAFGCVEPWSRAALEILAYLLALACFLRGRSAVSPAAAEFWLFPAAFAAAGVLQLQALAAPDGPWPLAPFTSAPHATAAAVLLWTAYAALLWSVPRILVTHEAARRYVRFLYGLGVVLSAFGLLQAATSPDKLYWLRTATRAGFGPYYNRDHAANVLLMSMAAGVGLLWSRMRHAPDADVSPRRHLRVQALLAGGILLMFTGIAASGSRGALLAMLLAAAATAFFGADFEKRSRRRRLRAAGALAGAVVVVFMAFRYVGAGAEAGARVERSITGRFSIYGDARRWWRDAPLFGTGLGSFETIYPSYQDVELRATVAHAHSDWLEIALEAGLVGLLASLAAAALAAAAAVRVWLTARSEEMRALIGGCLAAAAAFCVHALFEFCFQIPGNAVVFLGIVGFLLSAPSWADKGADRPRSRPPAALPSLLAAAAFLFLALAAARPAAAAWLADASGDSARRAAGLLRGYSLDPDPSFLDRLAQIDAQAAAGGEGDPRSLRDALSHSLAAIDLMPFNSDALYQAGACMFRLGRPADGQFVIGEARSVRFASFAGVERDSLPDYSRLPSRRR